MENFNFWDFEVWGSVNLISVLLLSLLAANSLKKLIPALKRSLIPSSVLGGLLLLLASALYEGSTGKLLFNTGFFGGNGCGTLEVLTYHCLALGFIATTLKPSDGKFGRQRSREIFNTGTLTVSTYLLQGVLGLGITIAAAAVDDGIFAAAGTLLPFGYGQGTGQALNYGNIYEQTYGFVGGRSFGLSIAALGFLSASFGGSIHLNLLRRKDHSSVPNHEDDFSEAMQLREIQGQNEIPMNGSIDKLTMQLVFIFLSYLIAYGLMSLLGRFVGALRSVLFGFNFLLGVVSASIVKGVNNLLMRRGLVRRQHISAFLMTRLSGFFFDVMIVAGIAAIRLNVLARYWPILIVLGLVGAFSTYFYTRRATRVLFPAYAEEQFMVMFGMLTGTASTGIILLRELDPDFETPAAENLVYQNFPAIVLGFPLMLLAPVIPERPGLSLAALALLFALMNLLLFREKLLRRGKKKSCEK